MATGGIISQNFDAKLHRVPFRMFTEEGLTGIPRVHSTFLNVIPTANLVEQDVLYSGLPAVPKVESDLQQSPLVDYSISAPVAYRQENYRMKYMFTRKADKYDNQGTVRAVISSMGEAMAYTMEVVAAGVLNNHATTTYAGWDTLALGSNSHALVGTTDTYDNLFTASGPTTGLLQAIYNYFKKVPNDQGFPVPVNITAVICAPEIGPAWRQLVSSTTQVGKGDSSQTGLYGVSGDQANTANPAIPNPFRHITEDMIVESPYLTDTGASFIIGQGHKLNMFVAEAPINRTWNNPDPEAIAHEITADFQVGFTDARRVVVVPGP